jgi:hypothetical protein
VNIVTCRDCGQEVWWGESALTGRRMPINKWSTSSGNVYAVDPDADTPVVVVLSKGESPPDPETRRYLSHFTTCPNARQRRRH